MVPATTARVAINTRSSVNDCIDERTRENVARYAGATPALIEERLRELSREWDVERITAAVAGLAALGGVLLVSGLGSVWLVVPLIVAAGLLLHAIIGWSPLLPLVRQMGFRTACEIHHERYALKALRGDFQRLDVITTPQDREDLARFEGEGGAVAPPPGPDAASPKAVHEAIQAVKS